MWPRLRAILLGLSPAPPAGGTAATGSFVRANRQRTIVPRGERPGAVEQVDDGQHIRGVAHTATIDVLVTPDGDHVFLEIDPAGEFFWLELNPGFAISEAFADLLLNRARRREHDLPTFAPQP